MPVDKKRYPIGWDEIAWEVKTRAGWRCEWCGIGHMADGTSGSCLTVHHPDRNPEEKEARLLALCARCHLRDEATARKYGRNKNQLTLWG